MHVTFVIQRKLERVDHLALGLVWSCFSRILLDTIGFTLIWLLIIIIDYYCSTIIIKEGILFLFICLYMMSFMSLRMVDFVVHLKADTWEFPSLFSGIFSFQ